MRLRTQQYEFAYTRTKMWRRYGCEWRKEEPGERLSSINIFRKICDNSVLRSCRNHDFIFFVFEFVTTGGKVESFVNLPAQIWTMPTLFEITDARRKKNRDKKVTWNSDRFKVNSVNAVVFFPSIYPEKQQSIFIVPLWLFPTHFPNQNPQRVYTCNHHRHTNTAKHLFSPSHV